jgi:hypothetical protein
MITRGEMAIETNRQGYDVVSSSNERMPIQKTSLETVPIPSRDHSGSRFGACAGRGEAAFEKDRIMKPREFPTHSTAKEQIENISVVGHAGNQ